MAERAEEAAHKALKEPFQGVFSLKVGDYRALYTLDHPNRTVLVVAVAHRSRVYRT
jgi:mRNA-degrading endonuclease RelE of RelBE toxin-antitoxin system